MRLNRKPHAKDPGGSQLTFITSCLPSFVGLVSRSFWSEAIASDQLVDALSIASSIVSKDYGTKNNY